jgi:hypothetical protein
MASVFPGMDPYIEGQAWGDFYSRFVVQIANTLGPRLDPRYVVRAEERVYVEHSPGEMPERIRPDVTVAPDWTASTQNLETAHDAPGVAAAPFVLNVPLPEEVRETFLTVRLPGSLDVVAVIEVLSPSNKRPGADGHREYLRKRESVLRSSSHLVELDLLRGGKRMPTVEPLPPGDYYALVCRGNRRPRAEVYAWSIRQPLPRVPIPLADGDPDANLDLGAIFAAVYEFSRYDRSVDYRRELQQPLNEPDAAWVKSLLPGE